MEGGADKVEGRCMKCKAQRTMVNVQQVKMKNGRPALKGVCEKCGTKMFKIVSTKSGKGEPASPKKRSRRSKASRKSKGSRKGSKRSRGSRKSKGSKRSRR